ncbi:MAG TPA: hypothetical protein DCS48_11185 [Desulfovibrio sp.]|nr:hypothetical protein [Desulfovibrio sp.]
MTDLLKDVPLKFHHSPEGLEWLSEVWSAYTRTSLSPKNVLHMLKIAEMLCGTKAEELPRQLDFFDEFQEEPLLQQFWNIFEEFKEDLNHSSNSASIAISLKHFCKFCDEKKLAPFDRNSLIKWLPYSTRYELLDSSRSMKSRLWRKNVRCWVFKNKNEDLPEAKTGPEYVQKSNITEATVKHIVLNRRGKPYKLGDEVIVLNEGHPRYNQIGEVCKIRNYDDTPKVSVCFDGCIGRYDPEEIDLC